MVFGLVAGPPNVHDWIRGRRSRQPAPTMQDFIRLAQHFNAIHIIGNQVVAPMELPANSRHLDTYRANLTLTDQSFHVRAIGRGRALDGIEMMAIARGITLDEMRADPGRDHDHLGQLAAAVRRGDGRGADAMAEHGQPVAVTPFTLMGAMTPVTLGRRAGPAECRGAVRRGADPARAAPARR